MQAVVVLQCPAIGARELDSATLVARGTTVYGLRVHPALHASKVSDQPSEGEALGLRRPLHFLRRNEHRHASRPFMNAGQLIEESADLSVWGLCHVISMAGVPRADD